MNKLRLYILLALLLMAGGVTMQGQTESYFTYEDPNFRFSEGGPCLEVGSDDSKNHFFLASAFDYSGEWMGYEQEFTSPARILKLSPKMELLGEMVFGEENRRSTITGIYQDQEQEGLFIAVGKIHDNEFHYDKPFMVRFDEELSVLWQEEVDLPEYYRKFFFWPKSFMDSQSDIVYMTEFYSDYYLNDIEYMYLRLSPEGEVMAIESAETEFLDKGGIFQYNDGSGDYGVCNSFTHSVQRLNRNFETIGQRIVPNNIVFNESTLDILLLRRFNASTILSMPDNTLFVAVDGDGWKYPDVVADAVLMKLSLSDTMSVVHANSFDGLFFSDCYNETTETVAEIKGLDRLGDHLFLCYCIMNYEPGGGIVGNSSFCVTKLTLGLDVVWQKVYDFNNRIMPRYVMATQDGGCLVTGEIGTGPNGEEGMMMFAVKIDSEGYLDVAEAENPVQYGECYPNPGTNVLNIRTALQNAWVEVYDMSGRMVYGQEITDNITAINTSAWPAGSYVWKVMAGTSTGSVTEAESGKWIKE
jgi:hypothetical protein